MQIFNVGALEILFILIIAFLVLGPKRTINTARDVGKWVRNIVKSPFWREIVTTSSEIRELPKKIMDDAELQKMIADLDLTSQELKQIINEAHSETEAELGKLEGEIDQEMQSTPSQSENSADEA